MLTIVTEPVAKLLDLTSELIDFLGIFDNLGVWLYKLRFIGVLELLTSAKSGLLLLILTTILLSISGSKGGILLIVLSLLLISILVLIIGLLLLVLLVLLVLLLYY